MALKTFQFPAFEDWIKTKSAKVEIGDYFATISHIKTYNQNEFVTEIFLAKLYKNNKEAIEHTTFINIPGQFSKEEFKAAYDSTCEWLNKTYKKYMYHTYWI